MLITLSIDVGYYDDLATVSGFPFLTKLEFRSSAYLEGMITVVCGIIERGDLVLAARRAPHKTHAGKWEFPGGKLEAAETAEQALHRELAEELSIEVRVHRRLPEVIHAYPTHSVCLLPLVCEFKQGITQLTDHDLCVWLPAEDLVELDWVAADLPVLDAYLRSL